MVFDILNFQGFAAATNLFDQPPAGGALSSVFMAVDIYDKANGYTGAVGLSLAPQITPFGSETPLPAAVWLMGSVLGGGGLLLRRRKKAALAV